MLSCWHFPSVGFIPVPDCQHKFLQVNLGFTYRTTEASYFERQIGSEDRQRRNKITAISVQSCHSGVKGCYSNLWSYSAGFSLTSSSRSLETGSVHQCQQLWRCRGETIQHAVQMGQHLAVQQELVIIEITLSFNSNILVLMRRLHEGKVFVPVSWLKTGVGQLSLVLSVCWSLHGTAFTAAEPLGCLCVPEAFSPLCALLLLLLT